MSVDKSCRLSKDRSAFIFVVCQSVFSWSTWLWR